MKLKVFSVYDSKVESYFKPFYCQTKGEAIRSFTEISNDNTSQIGKYPEDFTLFEVGEFDDANCSFELLDTPSSIGKAIEFVKPKG